MLIALDDGQNRAGKYLIEYTHTKTGDYRDDCPSTENGVDRFACPTADAYGRFLCIDDQHICNGYTDCPRGEDEDTMSCMFYKSHSLCLSMYYYRLIGACPLLWILGTFSVSLSLLGWTLLHRGLPSFEDPLVGFESTTTTTTVATPDDFPAATATAKPKRRNRFRNGKRRKQNSRRRNAEVNDLSKGLLELQSIRDLCTLDSLTIAQNGPGFHFAHYCETRGGEGRCCRSWSVPNYILLLAGKKEDDCRQITEADVTNFVRLLADCAPFYAENYLSEECAEGRTAACPNVPEHCTAHENLVFTVLHYLVDFRFLNVHQLKEQGQGQGQGQGQQQSLSNASTATSSTGFQLNNGTYQQQQLPFHYHLSSTSIFLPMAKSSKLLAYYRAITQLRLSTLAGSVQVVAADLGCKESLFSEALVSDLALLALSSTIIFGSLLAYTRSLLLTATALLTNIASLGTAYYLYSVLFGVAFFPFLNLLSLIILIGIGSDNALIYCKAWSCVAMLVRENSNGGGTDENGASNNSRTTYFGYEANRAEKRRSVGGSGGGRPLNLLKPKLFSRWSSKADAFSTFLFQRVILRLVFNYRHLLAATFLLLALASSLAVFYKPGLQLPTTAEFQVFSSAHLFERYDLKYQHEFWFSRLSVEKPPNSQAPRSSSSSPESTSPNHHQPLTNNNNNNNNHNLVLPIRLVFGVLPLDTGDHLDPFRRGTLTFDPAFNLSSPESQQWLLALCTDLRAQPFFRPTMGPLLSNCFIETFKAWMEERRCREELIGSSSSFSSSSSFNTSKEGETEAEVEIEDRFPCCQASTFPYEPAVFDRCLVEVVERLHRTPSYLFTLNGRSAGPRAGQGCFKSKPSSSKLNFNSYIFSSPTPSPSPFPRVKAVVIEYDSVFDAFTTGRSFEEMATFWRSVDQWLAEQLASAPEGLRSSGWFVTGSSEFFALQSALSAGVHRSLVISVGLAFGTLILTTASLRLSLLSTLSIACTIFTTIGALVVLADWRLNVIESITISLTIGLAIDATLHYTIVYRMLAKGNHLLGIQMTLARVGSPVAMGALTTFLAGSVMQLFSSILAYVQIGTFLMVLSVVSWLFSTLFHLSLLSIFGAPSRSEGRSVLAKLKCLWSKVFALKRFEGGNHSVSPAETEFSVSPPSLPKTTTTVASSSQPSSTSLSNESFEYIPRSDNSADHSAIANNNNELCYTTSTTKPPAPRPNNAFLRVTSI
ncbi:Protein dispatched 1 [Tyrophagus putrescentiae]|nr:Protein dispatched 1 [Tyrophagus putrescentiae]